MWIDQKNAPDACFQDLAKKYSKNKRSSFITGLVHDKTLSYSRRSLRKSTSAMSESTNFFTKERSLRKSTSSMSESTKLSTKECSLRKSTSSKTMSSYVLQLFASETISPEPKRKPRSSTSLPPKITIENVTVTLAIPTPIKSTVPFSDIFDPSTDDILSSSFETLGSKIIEMINADDTLHPELRTSLKVCAYMSQYSIAYIDYSQRILYTKQNAGRYYRRCISKGENPSLVVKFPAQVMSPAA